MDMLAVSPKPFPELVDLHHFHHFLHRQAQVHTVKRLVVFHGLFLFLFFFEKKKLHGLKNWVTG
jgi:hypothetical protein